MQGWRAGWRGLCAAVLVAACGGAAAQDDGVRVISGALALPETLSLPSDALVVVEALASEDRLVGEAVFLTRGAQPPFEIAVGVPTNVDVRLRAAVLVGSLPAWVMPERAISADVEDATLGAISLEPYAPLFTKAAYRCGKVRLEVGVYAEAAILEMDDERHILPRAPAGSGAVYGATGAPGLAFRDRGRRADLIVEGVAAPECAPVPPAPSASYKVRGNEPGWSVTIDGNTADIVTDYGAERTTTTVAGSDFVSGVLEVVFGSGDVLSLRPEICRDTMTGMPYPDQAELVRGDASVTGCGGRPVELLTGREWRIVTIAGETAEDATLVVAPSGGVSGSTGCNRYITALDVGGEAITTGPIAATKRLCLDPVMAQETALFRALAAVSRFDIGPDGALLFYGNDAPEPLLTATR